MELKNQSNKPLKGKRKQKMLPREKVQLLQILQITLEKSSENKNSKNRKKARGF